jgi:predicted nucleic acid-binding Zn ribbon protein
MSARQINPKDREKKPRLNSQQKKMRQQQIFMAIVGVILVLTMILALVIR